MRPREITRVLTISEDPEIHATIARALSLLGEQDAATLKIIRADSAESALSIAIAESPRIVFLDVTLGDSAGLGLVHFLPASVPGTTVIAIVPSHVDERARIVEQAASLGAAWVLLGELTGDDILRAFHRVVGDVRVSRAPPSMGYIPVPPMLFGQAPIEHGLSEVQSFRELDAELSVISAQLSAEDVRYSALVDEIRGVVARTLSHDRDARAPMQDRDTSAYSFAYFVDLAGREIDLARRHGRRFSLATVDVVPSVAAELDDGFTPPFDTRAAVELVLASVRDTDVVARADEHELLLLVPETGSRGGRTLRRRILDRLATHIGGRPERLPLRVGLGCFPYDGEDLSRLLRIARRRAERWAPNDPNVAVNALLSRALSWVDRTFLHGRTPNDPTVATLRPIEVPLRDAWSLLEVLVRESTRGGDAFVGMHAPDGGAESPLGLAHSVRSAVASVLGPSLSPGSQPPSLRNHNVSSGYATRPAPVLTLITGRSRLLAELEPSRSPLPETSLEVIGVLAEHACFGLIGRAYEGRFVGLTTQDLPVVEAILASLEHSVVRRGGLTSSVRSPSSPVSSRSPSDAPSFGSAVFGSGSGSIGDDMGRFGFGGI